MSINLSQQKMAMQGKTHLEPGRLSRTVREREQKLSKRYWWIHTNGKFLKPTAAWLTHNS